MESVKAVQKNSIFCHDCGKKIKIKEGKLINGKILEYEDGDKKLKVSKCDECYKKNPQLTNFRKCEVYSRIVGYLRPVQQWNEGKKQEFKEREEYKLRRT